MLRALAALLVLACHALDLSSDYPGRFSPDWLRNFGAVGVDIFFIISGFIMLHVSFRPNRAPPAPGGFLLRRVTRIYPLYWLCYLAVIGATSIGFLRHQPWTGLDAAMSLLLLPTRHLVVIVSWTLIYELYFYLIFAVMLMARSMEVAAIGSILAIVFFWMVSRILPGAILPAFLGDPIPLEFCMGLCLAWAYARRGQIFKRPVVAWCLALVGFGLMATASLYIPRLDAHYISRLDANELPDLRRTIAWGLPALLVTIGFLPIGSPRNPVTRFAVLLGDASYAMYLTHVFIIIGYGWVLKSTKFGDYNQVLAVLLVVAISVVVGLVTHLYIERPMLAIIRTVSTRRPKPLATPAV